MKHRLLLCLFLIQFAGNAQTLSDSTRISLMTVAPGEFVYSTFGHSAIRVKDPVTRFDRCYNYGTFEFEQPNFLLKFCRGKLLYNLDVETYRSFEYGNLQDRRPMQEQFFNLDQDQKQRLFDLLQENYKEENRYYKYDFFYDNCATRIRDIIQSTFFYQLQFDSTVMPKGVTMRQLLQPYLEEKPWLDFGIDLLLGLPADRKASLSDYMFLPDYMHNVFAKAKTGDGKVLVQSERNIPETPMKKEPFKPSPLDQPFLVMSFVAVIGLLSMANPRTEHIFDTLFWFILGVAGLIMALLWFATDHSATKTNLNILWAWPTHLFFFWRTRRTGPTENYFTVAALTAALLLIFWKWIPQEMPNPALPLLLLIVVKGLWRHYWKKEKVA
ncbi:MAG: DUF4105 domain-containing protein [Saprospiraceae bacterium]|nr:DUF4105 domain-containing protein [Saprospiraceae bacterium]